MRTSGRDGTLRAAGRRVWQRLAGLWLQANQIGRITTKGAFTEVNANQIGRITTPGSGGS